MSLKDRIGAGIAALVVLLLFGGVGALAAWAIGATIHDGVRSQDWVGVRGRVQNVSEGSATYQYEWQGRRYSGDRVGTFVLGGNSAIDDWDDRMDAMLTAAVSEEKPVIVFVNPENPSESILNREIRWKLLLFFLPFAVGFGAGGLAGGWLIGRSALGVRERRASVPLLNAPARTALFQWGVAVVWNSLAFPVALLALPEMWAKDEWFPLVLISLFPLFGLLILWSALASTVQVVRAGSPFNARTAR